MGKKPVRLFIPAIFFTYLFLYVFLVVQPELIYHKFALQPDSPVFYTTLSFLKHHFTEPGLLLRYLSAFLLQGFYYPPLGALIITLTAWFFYPALKTLFKVFGARVPVIPYLPGLVLIMTCNRYCYMLDVFFALLSAVIAFILYQKISPKNISGRLVLFTVFSAAIYYIIGASSLFFTLLVVIQEIFEARRVFVGLVYLLIGLFVCAFIGVFVFQLPLPAAGLRLTAFSPELAVALVNERAVIFVKCMYLVIGVAVVLISVFKQKSSDTAQKIKSFAAKPIFEICCLGLAILFSIVLSYDRREKLKWRIVYAMDHQERQEVLELVQQAIPEHYTMISNHCLNRSLAEMGKLGDSMFTYPQKKSSLFLETTQSIISLNMWLQSEVNLQIGNLNGAQRHAMNAMEITGPSPVILHRLVMVNLAKGQYDIAHVFLEKLKNHLHYRKEAQEILSQMQTDPEMRSNPNITHLRSIMLLENEPLPLVDYEPLLKRLLEVNKHNRMAFEYLMGHYMLTGQVDKLAANINRFKDFGFETIPYHYQEAIIIHADTIGRKPNLGQYELTPGIIEQSRVFRGILDPLAGNKQAAFNRLGADFSRTYFFFYTFGVSGSAD